MAAAGRCLGRTYTCVVRHSKHRMITGHGQDTLDACAESSHNICG